MENTARLPTPDDARAALLDAEASRDRLASGLRLPSFFYSSIGAAVAFQIATTAVGVSQDRVWARCLLAAGVLAFLAVASCQLARFRRANGVWVGGLASRLVLGTATTASASYAVAAAAAIWAAFASVWWLVPLCAVGGGAAYALSGRSWLRTYRADPATHGRGDSAFALAGLAALAAAGLVLLVALR